MTARCQSCRAPIVWAKTEAGKPIPLDPDPVPDGNLALASWETGQAPRVRYLRKGDDPPDPMVRRVAHFATCPAAKRHRRR